MYLFDMLLNAYELYCYDMYADFFHKKGKKGRSNDNYRDRFPIDSSF